MCADVDHYDKIAEEAWSAWLTGFLGRLKPIAAKAKWSDLYWNERLCEVRCEKHAGKLGYRDTSSNEDGQRYCEKCGIVLEHRFTDWGEEEEIGYSADPDMLDKPISPDEAFTLISVIESGCPLLSERWPDYDYHSDLRPSLLLIAKRLELNG